MSRRGRHHTNGRRGAYYDDRDFASEGYQMPPSSQTSYHDSYDWGADDGYQRPSNFSRYDPPLPSSSQFSSRSPPRAPRAMREKSRSATPPPSLEPLPDYLTLSEQTPSRIDKPSSSRKLLVLDLNGTLLHRSPHVARPKSQFRDRHSGFLPRLRPVHPRPYMLAFRSYLFAPQTAAWLDVMVWSSAQPHSVDDMVDKCFGRNKDKLIAVWARDMLGLSTDHYFRKVQTVKDLAKPWSLLGPKPTTNQLSPSIASTPTGSPSPSSPTRPSDDSTGDDDVSPQAHSALTTLLLDDSSLKAGLQPYNHVCIGEYTGEQRSKDLASLQKEQDWRDVVATRELLDDFIPNSVDDSATDPQALSEPPPRDGSPEAEAQTHDTAQSPEAVLDEESTAAPEKTSKKRKRKNKKLLKRAALLEQAASRGQPDISYDETLLAVIGVLHEVKAQANVAAWIRSNGLWGPPGPPALRSSNLEVVGKVTASDPSSSTPVKAASDEDAANDSDDSDLSVGNDRSADVTSKQSGSRGDHKRKKKRRRLLEVNGGEAAGNDEDAVAPVSSPSGQREPSAVGEVVLSKMWFEDSAVLEYWTSRGRAALEELGIPVEHGIER